MPRLLVIDDDDLVSGMLKEHLTLEGYEVETATLAENGFNQAVENPPDLIMLDVMMPDATGYQMCGRLRAHPATQFIPIIMMTGFARFPSQQSFGKMLGADAYIVKPFEVDNVSEKIRDLLASKNQAVFQPSKIEQQVLGQSAEEASPFQVTGTETTPDFSAPETPTEPVLTQSSAEPGLSAVRPFTTTPESPLEERCLAFSARVLELISRLPDNLAGQKIADQLMKSGVSLGAGARRNGADLILQKEIRETRYWLDVVQKASLFSGQILDQLRQECLELSSLLTKTDE